jgi:hypothetical protein
VECIQKVTQPDIGVGATAEARLRALAPLIEYFAREMGELPGRLMIAASFLGDVQLLPDWSSQSAEHLQAVEQAQALVVSVMIRLLNMEERSGCGSGQRPDLPGERRPDVDH